VPSSKSLQTSTGAYATLRGPKVEREHRKGGPKGVTQDEADKIRRVYARNEQATMTALAKRFGVSITTISLILHAEKHFAYLGEDVTK
jgi:hypothetical protein